MKTNAALIGLCLLSSSFAEDAPATYDLYWQAPRGAIVMLNGERVEGQDVVDPSADYSTSRYLPIKSAQIALKPADVLGVICQTAVKSRYGHNSYCDDYLLLAVRKEGKILLGSDNRSWYYTERNPDAIFWKTTSAMGAKIAKRANNVCSQDVMQFYSAIGATPDKILPVMGDVSRISYFKRAIATLDLQAQIGR